MKKEEEEAEAKAEKKKEDLENFAPNKAIKAAEDKAANW